MADQLPPRSHNSRGAPDRRNMNNRYQNDNKTSPKTQLLTVPQQKYTVHSRRGTFVDPQSRKMDSKRWIEIGSLDERRGTFDQIPDINLFASKQTHSKSKQFTKSPRVIPRVRQSLRRKKEALLGHGKRENDGEASEPILNAAKVSLLRKGDLVQKNPPDSPFTPRRAESKSLARSLAVHYGIKKPLPPSGSGGQTKSDMMISLSRDDAVYKAGERVEGKVTLVLTQDVKIKDLQLKVQGISRVSWKEVKFYFRGSTTVGLKNCDKLLDMKINLLRPDRSSSIIESRSSFKGSRSSKQQGQAPQNDESAITMGPGCYTFPFQFPLYYELPGTFSGQWGEIKYNIKAVLIRPWKFDVERDTEIIVQQRTDLNDEPELARPIGALGEYSNGWLCIRSAPINVELRTGKRGYATGENILLFAEIENSSKGVFNCVRAQLVQTVTYKADHKVRRTQTIIASIQREPISPQSSVVWNTDDLIVPDDTKPTSNSANIQIKYTVAIALARSSRHKEKDMAADYTLSVPVTIGSIPLERHIINSYLNSSIMAAVEAATQSGGQERPVVPGTPRSSQKFKNSAPAQSTAASETAQEENKMMENKDFNEEKEQDSNSVRCSDAKVSGETPENTLTKPPGMVSRKQLARRMLSDTDAMKISHSMQNLDARGAKGRSSITTTHPVKSSVKTSDNKRRGSDL